MFSSPKENTKNWKGKDYSKVLRIKSWIKETYSSHACKLTNCFYILQFLIGYKVQMYLTVSFIISLQLIDPIIILFFIWPSSMNWSIFKNRNIYRHFYIGANNTLAIKHSYAQIYFTQFSIKLCSKNLRPGWCICVVWF